MKRVIHYGIFLILIIIFCFVIFTPTQSALVFYERDSDNITAYLPLQEKQKFHITFVHSIHLTDVVEKYEITEENTIRQYEMIFEQFGIGMPSTVEGKERFVYEDGKYRIKNMNNVFDSMNIRNGKTVSNHRLSWIDRHGKQHTTPFNDYFEPGNWYTLKVENISLFTSWKEVKIRERVQE